MFKKGRTKTGGRKPGSKNKSPEQLRSILQAFLAANLDDIQAVYNKLSNSQKIQYLDKLLCHILPRPKDELERLSDEDLQRIIDKLKKNE